MQKKLSAVGSLSKILFPFVLAAVETLSLAFFLWSIPSHLDFAKKQFSASDWKVARADLISCEPVARHRWNMQLGVKYQFTVDDQIYEGNQDRGWLSRQGHEFNSCANERIREINSQASSNTLTVYYNPAAPEENMLSRSWFFADYWMAFA